MKILIRWAIAFVLLALTFNPTEFNYVRWSAANLDTQLPLVVLFGLILSVGYIIYLRATFRSIGMFGMLLVLAVVGSLVWVLVDWGILTLDNPGLNVWIGIFALSLVLGVGLGWSHVRRAITGQHDIDDVDD